jgi:hypothetical protein
VLLAIAAIVLVLWLPWFLLICIGGAPTHIRIELR